MASILAWWQEALAEWPFVIATGASIAAMVTFYHNVQQIRINRSMAEKLGYEIEKLQREARKENSHIIIPTPSEIEKYSSILYVSMFPFIPTAVNGLAILVAMTFLLIGPSQHSNEISKIINHSILEEHYIDTLREIAELNMKILLICDGVGNSDSSNDGLSYFCHTSRESIDTLLAQEQAFAESRPAMKRPFPILSEMNKYLLPSLK